MRDNVLKKELNKKDVQRIRNLVQGKYGDKTTQSVGYKKGYIKTKYMLDDIDDSEEENEFYNIEN